MSSVIADQSFMLGPTPQRTVDRAEPDTVHDVNMQWNSATLIEY